MSSSHSAATPLKVSPNSTRHIERHDWWLWSSAILVILLLTAGLASFIFVFDHVPGDLSYSINLALAIRGLIGTVLLFDIYAIFQQCKIHQIRRQLAEKNELFRLISENAADMIAVVDFQGRRLYNSPAYQRILGYSPEELGSTSSLEQIHPDDRQQVLEAAEQARGSGVGRMVEYRMRHKDGSWRFLESTASVILDSRGNPEKLVIVNRDITARKLAEERLAYNTFHDTLTRLPNRALFLDRVQQAFSHARRHSDYQFAVLVIDVDDFKKFNDSLGPGAGDQVLLEIARRLTTSLRRSDTVSRLTADANQETVARLGGDEFAILLEDMKNPSDAIRVADRIHHVLGAPFSLKDQEVFASASIGIAMSAPSYEDAEELLRDADTAMYRGKSLGTGRYQLFDSYMHARAVDRLKLETALRKAVEHHEFDNYYQPIVALASRRITGFETLVRWRHPQEGTITPDKFLDVADETGLIVPINNWLLRDACRRVQLWNDQRRSEIPITIAANITSHQFSEPNLVANVAAILAQTRLDPSLLELEITETVAMNRADKAISVLSELKLLGVRLSIDDFGTGYSSLSRLQKLPVDTVKIDRSFVARVHMDPGSREIVRIIAMLAQHLGLKVVAEGIESEEQLKYLLDLGCDFAQGYLFSRPVAEEVAQELLTAESHHSTTSSQMSPVN